MKPNAHYSYASAALYRVSTTLCLAVLICLSVIVAMVSSLTCSLCNVVGAILVVVMPTFID